MTPALRESRQSVRRAGRATTFLVVLSAMLMMVLGGTFGYLTIRQDSLQDSIREDALWAVYQLDREARTLSLTVDHIANGQDLGRTQVEELGLRYDILYSRLSVLDNAKYDASLATSAGFLGARTAVREGILQLEPFFNGLASADTVSRDGLREVRSQLDQLLAVTERTLTDTNTSVSAARADARAEVMWIQQATAALVLIISVSIGLLILNLTRQLRLTRRTTRQLESAAQELATAYDAAESGNRAKSEFMAVMGHEIRTPLNAILGMAELLSSAELPEEDRQGVRVITSSGQALLEIINEILDFAKIEHGDIVLEKIAFDAGTLVQDAVEVVAGRAVEQGNRLTVSTSALPSFKLVSDPTRIRRVLLNLLSNAVKFTKGGTVGITASMPLDGQLRFEVSDSGIGISAEALPRLFKAFTQEDSTISRRFGGTGLGLAICKKVVEAMGGEIGVSSSPGAGSCFWFQIPVTMAEPILHGPSGEIQSGALPSLDVLVVEDNAINREVARRFLDRLGQRTSMAVDGAEGVEMAAAYTYDIVLMDMQMPVMDGIAATRAIRAAEAGTGRRTRIVATTANASDTDRARCMEAGMDGFVAKPLTLDQLAGAIHACRSLVPAAADGSIAPAHLEVDAARRAELVAVFGDEGLRELDATFFADMAGILRDLHAALASGDREHTDRLLHSVKGAASNLGFAELASFAETARATAPGAIKAEMEQRLIRLSGQGGAAQAA